MKCQACGHDNADSALFCTACRRPLVATPSLPTRIEPLTPAAMPAAAMAASAARPAEPGNRFAAPGSSVTGRSNGDTASLTDDEARAAFIGDANAAYYLDRFDRLAHGASGGWHWPGMLVTWYWMLYRKMWVPALIYFFAPYLIVVALAGVAAGSPAVAGALYLAWLAVWLIGPGFLANGWYYKHAMARIRDVRARGGSKEQMLARLEAAGGTSNVLVIIFAFFGIFAVIGILAAIALPAYQTYTVKAKVSEAVLVGVDVAQAVGRQYEQTGALPSDVEHLVSEAPHHSRFVSGVEMDSHSGTITVKIDAGGRVQGAVQMVPNADASRHITWTCTTEDLKRFVPAACRNGASR